MAFELIAPAMDEQVGFDFHATLLEDWGPTDGKTNQKARQMIIPMDWAVVSRG
jgi:hypothetical protein